MNKRWTGILWFTLLFNGAPPVWAQLPVAKIEIYTQPEDRKVRPLESMVFQLRAFAEQTDSDGTKQMVRLKKNIDKVHILESEAGWLSKPFLFQGNDVLASDLKGLGKLSSLLGTAETFLWQDSVLYTAPEKPCTLHIEVELEGKKSQVEIKVTPDASSTRKPEQASFPAEPSNPDPYLFLVEHYAPFIAQETWFTPKADFITRFNFDGDWKGSDNWDDMEIGTSQSYVHYTAMETATHWFLIYNFFHPRDYSDRCVAGTCHENDNEGIILTVAKDGSRYGRLRVMETLAHNNIYDFSNDNRIRSGVHDIDGTIEFMDESHPVIFIESGGHGIYGSTSSHSRLKNKEEFTAGTGVTFRFKGVAERPRHPNDRNVGYALLPIYQEWWVKMKEGDPSANIMFDEYFIYTPYGMRPGTSLPRIAGAFFGRKEASNKARPFWGWFDVQTQKKKVLANGQWGLDPAYSVSHNLHFPDGEPFSQDYLFNPYLVGGAGQTPPSTSATSTQSDSLEDRNATAAASRREAREQTRPSPTPSIIPPSPQSPLSRASNLPEILFKRLPGFEQNRDHGALDLRLKVDGSIVLSIRGDHIWYETKSGRPPLDAGTEMDNPLPISDLKKLDYEKKDGRGSVQLLSRPSASNHFTLQLQIDDPKGGEDGYRIRITWSR